MSKFKSFSAAVLAVAVAATATYAADALPGENVSIIPSVGGVTVNGSAVAPPTDLIGNTLYIYSSGAPAIYTINYSVLATGFTATNDVFNSVIFGVNGTSGLTLGGYTPNNSAGAWTTDDSILINGSFGPNPSTLQQIAASTGSGSTFPNFAITSPAAVGSVAVAWNGTTSETLSISDGNGNIGQIQYSTAQQGINNEVYTSDPLTVKFVTPLVGDANFDGTVGLTDLGILATNYGLSGTRGAGMGDFNDDGTVGLSDLGLLATNYGDVWTNGLGAGPGIAHPSLAAAPEPASLGLLALGGLAMLRRRRKA